jgi:hypothetical protein
MASTKDIAATLWTAVKPGMKPKELYAAVRERHPEASKKEIVRAAFYALTDSPISGSQVLTDLHNFALVERGQDDGADTAATVGEYRKKNRGTERHSGHVVSRSS